MYCGQISWADKAQSDSDRPQREMRGYSTFKRDAVPALTAIQRTPDSECCAFPVFGAELLQMFKDDAGNG